MRLGYGALAVVAFAYACRFALALLRPVLMPLVVLGVVVMVGSWMYRRRLDRFFGG